MKHFMRVLVFSFHITHFVLLAIYFLFCDKPNMEKEKIKEFLEIDENSIWKFYIIDWLMIIKETVSEMSGTLK